MDIQENTPIPEDIEPRVDVDLVQDLTDAETHPALDAVVETQEPQTEEPAPSAMRDEFAKIEAGFAALEFDPVAFAHAVIDAKRPPTTPAPRLATDLVHTHFDNEADDGATCLCTLTFKDGGVALGSAPRTNNLNADQAAAFAQAMGA